MPKYFVVRVCSKFMNGFRTCVILNAAERSEELCGDGIISPTAGNARNFGTICGQGKRGPGAGTNKTQKAQSEFPIVDNFWLALAKEFCVNSEDWPDYVFEPSYRLAGLDEVEKYVTRHHHLPDMPAASEVNRTGIALGETEAKLTQKVEELTLYIIAQNNAILALEKRVENLESK